MIWILKWIYQWWNEDIRDWWTYGKGKKYHD